MENIKFESINLSKEIQKAVSDMGFEEMSPIQAQAIPVIMEGKDVIGQSQTGTGKTAAFGIPILEMTDTRSKDTESLILCPTRELAIQVVEELKKLSKYKKGINIVPIYGGQSIDRQIGLIRRGVHIVVGTPGRVMDHMRRGTLNFKNIKRIVLDEADEMLDMGFRDDIEIILKETSAERQTILFSATMAKQILDITKKYQTNPELVKVVHKELTVPSIEQVYFEVKESLKLQLLCRLIDMHNPKLSLVFCNTKKNVDELVLQLQNRGYFVDGLHGDLKQSQRDRVMSKFRNGTIDILIATDVAARGIDVDDVEIVFNYDLPQDEEYYVHRIGRTGRAGRAGRAFTFVSGKSIYKLKDIQRYTKTKIDRGEIPTINDVEESKIDAFFEKVKTVMDESDLARYVKHIESLLNDEYTSVDVAAALLKMSIGLENKEENMEVAYSGNYNSSNFNASNFNNTGGEPGMARLFINAGRNQNILPKDVIGAIAGETGIAGKLIGKIDIYDKYTFVEVPVEYTETVLEIMKNNKIKGKTINIEPANSK